MQMKLILFKVIFLILICFSVAYGDTLYLKNGRSIKGLIKSEDEDSIELEVNAGVVKFKRAEIDKIVRALPGEESQIRQKWESERRGLQEKISKQQFEEENKPRKAEFSQGQQGISVAVILNNKVEASLILDTGSSLVMLRKDIVNRLGLNLDTPNPDMEAQLADGRKVKAKRLVLESVKVQNSEANNVDAVVLLEEENISFAEGLLGMSFLSRFNFKVDQKEKKLILEKL